MIVKFITNSGDIAVLGKFKKVSWKDIQRYVKMFKTLWIEV